MKSYKILKFLIIFIGIICLGVVTTYIVFALTGVLDRKIHIDIVFAIATPTVFVILTIITAIFSSIRLSMKHNRIDNKYVFGKELDFYNSYLFNNSVTRLLKKGKYKSLDPYLISFTATKHVVMNNYTRNEIVTNFLDLIAEWIVSEFSGKELSKYTKHPISYCFYHGTFLLFMFGDESGVETLTNEIENNLHMLASSNQINLYVQPFFGVTKIDRNTYTFAESSTEAMTARSFAEKRYQSIIFYDKTESSSTSKSDADDIRYGLENNEFVVYYQPKFSLTEQRFISSEALIRWDSKKHGLLPPATFIEAAEASGLIHMIDEFVLEQVCRDIQDNRAKGRRVLPVSVNFSVQEFYDTNFISEIVETCKKYHVPFHYIEIEVTESTSQTNSFMSLTLINKLRDLGFRVLMDDFGTGFSNIENLMLIPFDAVKLDRSYIQRIESDPKSRELVGFLIKLCKSNNMEVIAEGVDNSEQVRILRRAGCDTIQGYYYSRPLPKHAVDRFLLPGGNDFEKYSKREMENM